MKSVCTAVLLTLGFSLCALGDVLILKDGTELRGAVTKDKSSEETNYVIELPDGSQATYPRAEVKRWVYESRLSEDEVEELFNDWADLVVPTLYADEPQQGRVPRNPGDFGTTPIGRGWMLYFSELGGDANREAVTSDRFTDEWARFSAPFEALRRNPLYAKQMDGSKGSGSLKEFVFYPHTDRPQLADALKSAMEGMERCLELEERATNAARAASLGSARDLAESRRAHSFAKRKTETARTKSAKRRAAKARESARNADIERQEKAQQAAERLDTLINDLARERLIVLNQIKSIGLMFRDSGAESAPE